MQCHATISVDCQASVRVAQYSIILAICSRLMVLTSFSLYPFSQFFIHEHASSFQVVFAL